MSTFTLVTFVSCAILTSVSVVSLLKPTGTDVEQMKWPIDKDVPSVQVLSHLYNLNVLIY